MDSRISLLRPCKWEEVFLEWYKNEGENSDWTALAKDRGFASWAEWRLKGYAERFGCREAEWGLYEIMNPSPVVSEWYGGPFRTWIERYYGGAHAMQFSEIAKHLGLQQASKIRSIVEDYPALSVISALQLPDGTVHVIEGMHRSVALSIMLYDEKPFHGTLLFAIGKTALTELPEVGKNTSK